MSCEQLPSQFAMISVNIRYFDPRKTAKHTEIQYRQTYACRELAWRPILAGLSWILGFPGQTDRQTSTEVVKRHINLKTSSRVVLLLWQRRLACWSQHKDCCLHSCRFWFLRSSALSENQHSLAIKPFPAGSRRQLRERQVWAQEGAVSAAPCLRLQQLPVQNMDMCDAASL